MASTSVIERMLGARQNRAMMLLRQIFHESAETYIAKDAKLALQEKAHCFEVSVLVSSVVRQLYPCRYERESLHS